MELTKRLTTIASYVEKGMTVADIGTDHGYVPIYLVKEGISDKVIAMDINKDPLNKAKANGQAYHVADHIEYRLSNGLEKLKEKEVDCVVIAGMGGKLVEQLLISEKDKLTGYKRLILSPHRDIDSVRKTLGDLKLPIVIEDMLEEEGHYYNIIVVDPVSDTRSGEKPQEDSGKVGGPVSDTGMGERSLGDSAKVRGGVSDTDTYFLQFFEKNEISTKIYNKYGKLLIEKKNQVLKQQLLKQLSGNKELKVRLEANNVHNRVEELEVEINIGEKVLKWLD